jgi:hypothetical protein
MDINEPKHEPVDREAIAAGHEQDVVNTRVVILSGVGLFALMIVSFVLMLAFWRALDFAFGDDPTTGIASKDRTPVPPGVPVLDADQAAQLVRLRESQLAWLNEYQWENKAEGIARIPIERAMAILAKDGLPATPPATVTDVVAPQGNE